ncbi:hypothetical protein [Rhodanobacter thiooxydans]|uniref:hypothetical protein n=1 Tax=Rhodanobacter thiooxydans TaxID=416169 RepID=UPI001F40C28F|nr:hypothetical protein [Rhodanobacter thiooxydans]UJJ56792.1 hypothetical protein LRK53_18425 [Rhodanobacter thiooxydans]
MTFDHQCFSHEQAAADKDRRLSAHPDLPPVVGRLKLSSFLGMVAVNLIAAGFIVARSSTDETDMQWIGATVAVIGMCVVAGALNRWVREQDPAIQRARVEDDFRKADNGDLEWLQTAVARYPLIADTVRSWLQEDKVIRQRDIRAIRAFTVKHDPVVTRQKLLQQLRVADGSSTAQNA